jgi:4-diphosphocytidyl-2-C-methyl-D-erythritol kinase
MKLLAPAKINLHLRVGPVNRQSGFHPLMSWFCTVGLFDTLLIEQDSHSAVAFSLTCDDPALPCDATNLVVRAADALRRSAGENGQALSKIRAQLQKRIPAGGGLGGGSSDAARTLLGLNRMWLLNH